MRFIRIFLSCATLFLFVSSGSFVLSKKVKAQSVAPASPNASQNTRAVLDYFYTLKGRAETNQTTNRVLSGQQFPTADFDGSGTGWTSYNHHIVDLNTQTGKWVGMIGVDLAMGSDAEISAVLPTLISYWQSGGLITINWHIRNPWTGGDAFDRTSSNITDLLTTGTAANTAYLSALNSRAVWLAQLRDAGVPVVFRPFHEMNNNDFWWSKGAGVSQTDFIRLWQHMFNYYTNTKGLNNLLWLYSPNVQWSSNTASVQTTDYYYPGSNYVDLVGEDVYAYGGTFLPNNNSSYTKLLALGKPLGLSEVGPWTTQQDGSWDNMIYINKIKSDAPWASFFQAWNSWPNAKMALVDTQNATALLNDPWVVTREEIVLPDSPTVSLNKSVDKTSAQSGDILTYTISYAVGGQGANNIIISDNIPSGTTYVCGSAELSGGIPDIACPGTTKITWNLGNKSPGDIGSVSFQVKIP